MRKTALLTVILSTVLAAALTHAEGGNVEPTWASIDGPPPPPGWRAPK